jgi:hypothetical protein
MGILKDFDCSRVAREKTVEGTSDYNLVRPGMAYDGVCRKAGCRANGHMVVCNRGTGNHLVNDDITMNRIVCPICSMPFEMREIILYQCRADVTVHAREEQTSTLVAQGDEIVKIGSRVGAPIFESCLVTINTSALGITKSGKGCVVM